MSSLIMVKKLVNGEGHSGTTLDKVASKDQLQESSMVKHSDFNFEGDPTHLKYYEQAKVLVRMLYMYN